MRRAGLIAPAIAVVLTVAIATAYSRDISSARARLEAGSRQLETRCGPVEVAVEGQGPAALVIHGAGGGYDQALLLGRALLGDSFRVIAPSRFGYLRQPIPERPTVEAQADVFACLLDALGERDVLALGISAGGPSSIAFARRYPERTRALVLVAAISRRGEPGSLLTQAVTEAFLRLDFVYWALWRTAGDVLLRALGVDAELLATLNPDERRQAEEIGPEKVSTMSPE